MGMTAKVALVSIFAAGLVHFSGPGSIARSQVDSDEGGLEIEPVDPTVIPGVIENLPPDVRKAVLDRAAPALATAIRESRRQAVERGVSAIPPQVRAALDPYFSPEVLDKVRWTTAAGISLDGVLASWFSLEGAVTLGDVIAFTDGSQAQEDVELWAHELTHVDQYERLGIDGFAFEYLQDFRDLESQASSNAKRIMARKQDAPQSGASFRPLPRVRRFQYRSGPSVMGTG
jgi:hypothetical protein